MDDNALKTLVSQGLGAMRAGSEVARKATREIQDDASHPKLKQALEEGSSTARQWAKRIDDAIEAVGGTGTAENPILEAHYEVSKRIRAEAKGDASRDLGIVAAGQLALHYWIAAFGTMGAYTKRLGMTDTAKAMSDCVDEAKRADEGHTEIARAIMGA